MRVCLLTGASGLLGTHFINQYADRYAIIACQHEVGIRASGATRTITADLRDYAAVTAMVITAANAMGRIDLVVNAAAVSLRRWHDPRTALAHYVDVMAVNVAGTAWVTAAVAAICWQEPDEKARRSVVNVSSTSGHEVYDGEHDLAYPASKAAVNMLTVHQAGELEAFGVRVNAVAPTSFPRLIPVGRVTEAIVSLDEGDETGRILIIGREGNCWLGDEAQPNS
ncbi:MAG TPA: SDR family oxidoreductase [Pseudonocardiaceae bacterium]|nr:SDR family oxidoreductase [Pseudonocardiaceae bacterium]